MSLPPVVSLSPVVSLPPTAISFAAHTSLSLGLTYLPTPGGLANPTFLRSHSPIPPFSKSDPPPSSPRTYVHTFAGATLINTLPTPHSLLASTATEYVLITPGDKQVLTRYEGGGLTNTYFVDAKIHGNIVTDAWFGGAALTASHLIYPAYAPSTPTISSFTLPPPNGPANPTVGVTNVVGVGIFEDAGETYTDKPPRINLYILDFATGVTTPVTATPDYADHQDGKHICVHHPVISEKQNLLTYTVHAPATPTDRSMGSVYCTNRPCSVHLATYTSIPGLVTSSRLISGAYKLARGGMFGSDGRVVYWSSKEGFDVHNSAFAVTVDEKQVTKESMFPTSVAVSVVGGVGDGKCIVTVNEHCNVVIKIVDLSTGVATPFEPSGEALGITSRLALVVTDGCLVYKACSPKIPGVVGVARNGVVERCLTFPSLNTCLGDISPPVMNFDVHFINAALPGKDDDSRPDCFLLLPQGVVRPPVVLVPHGGPHGMSASGYIPSYAFLANEGYAVLHVNYRGSTGYGKAFCDVLKGNVGRMDVDDCMTCLEKCVEGFDVDGERVGVCGGSHGGFLAGHLIGQFPEKFAAAAMRNPVTNLASMVTTSDIFDWVYTETLGSNKATYGVPSKDDLCRMFDASPIRYLEAVKTPVLMALGLSDRRVPPSQGVEYYYALRAKGVESKMIAYKEDVHAISKPESEADHWVQIKEWMDEHLRK